MTASYTMDLTGTVRVRPLLGTVPISGDFSSAAPVQESVGLVKKVDVVLSLDADSAEVVNLGDLAGVHVLCTRVLTAGAGTVLVRLTHADGTLQVVPVDPFLYVVTNTSPITALTLQRSIGVATTVPDETVEVSNG